MTEAFENELIQTGFIHKLLKPAGGKSAEARLLQKKAELTRPLWDGASLEAWGKTGEGEIGLTGEGLRINAPARREFTSAMPHYTGFGSIKAALAFQGEDWRGYNRVRCRVKPDCKGFHAPFLTLSLVNDGERKIPDVYMREGFHVINMRNDEWNDCVWEFPDLPRDKVTEFAFNLNCYGREISGAEDFVFHVRDIFLEQVENPDVSLGWQCAANTVCYSTSGYFSDGRKKAVTAFEDGSFELLEEPGERVAYSGQIDRLENEKGVFGIIDFSSFRESGRFRLRVNGVVTESFAISSNPFDEAVWKTVNFIYAERCGFPVGGGHGFCHGDILAEHCDLRMVYCGGWHDAGDLSQQTLQTAEVAHALFETALRVKNDLSLYNRLMEEACWGLDFVLRTRFGDGYRATSNGICRWTNSLIGDADDEKARVHNRSFENFLMGGVEAFAAFALRSEDPEKAFAALKAAKEDYAFALERFTLAGCESKVIMEHTHNAGRSQYYAAASWCASQIYRACGEEYYADEAARFGDLMLACQDTGDAGLPFSGFFYRDESKKVITHFNHQSREHIFPQAIAALCETQKSAPMLGVWEEALRRFGDYLKAMNRYSAPYGMQPAGVHAYNEADDAETFPYLHLMTDFGSGRENYREQLASGIQLDGKHCVRQFPVWFSFRGNSAVMLSSGKAASLIGRYFGDGELMEIARDQLYWHAGKNPFGQSLMYGEGCNYAQQYAALLGETVGEMPVGVQTCENGDVPYWPMANNATYKEVWMSTVGHWLWLIADMYGDR